MNVNILYVIVLIVFLLILYFIPVSTYLLAKKSGINISIFEFVAMRLRKVPVNLIVKGLIIAKKAELIIKKEELEAYTLAGGNIENVIYGMVAAKKSGVLLSFKQATNEDMNGVNLVEKYSEKSI